jgi:tetratricopeptide (TPR) repeat protein
MLTDRTGSRDAALAAFGKTRDFWEGMAAEKKADPRVVESQAATLCQIAGIQDAQGNSEEAIRTLEAARELAVPQVSGSKVTDAQKLTLIEIDKNLATCLHHVGKDSEALGAIENAQKAVDKMPIVGRGGADPRILLLQCIRLRGEILYSIGRAEEAIRQFESGLRLDDGDRPGEPANPEIKQMVSQLENDVGIHYLFTGNLEKSLTCFAASRKRKSEIAAFFPAVWKFQEDLAIAWNNEADVQNRLGHSADALISNQNSLAIRDGLVDLDPDNINAQHFVACSWNNIGDVLMWAGQLDEALAVYDVAIQQFERVVQRNPETMESAKWLGGCWTARGDLLEWNDRTADALEAHQRALEIRRKIVDASPGAVDCLQAVAVSQDRLDRILVRAGRESEAVISRQEAFDIREKLGRENANFIVCIVDQATSLARQGWQLHRDGKANEAVAALRRAIEMMPREPGSLDWKYSLGTFHALLSAAARETQLGVSADEAETESRMAVEILRQVAIQGYCPLKRYETDADLQSLSIRPDFLALIHEIGTLVKENESLQRPVLR